MNKIYAIIACAGMGKRTGLNENKIFYKIDDNSIVRKTVLTFSSIDIINEIIVVYKEGEKQLIKNELTGIDKKIRFVQGGNERYDSVKNALDTIKDGIVLIHDGARPFIKKEDILKCINSTIKYGSGVLCTNLTDTVCQVDNDD